MSDKIDSRFYDNEPFYRKVCIRSQCRFFDNQKDNNDSIVLIYCSHKDNKDEHEGNCLPDLCPLKLNISNGPLLQNLNKELNELENSIKNKIHTLNDKYDIIIGEIYLSYNNNNPVIGKEIKPLIHKVNLAVSTRGW